MAKDVIIACDFNSKEEVMNFLKGFNEPIYVKIGMELTYACGLDIVKDVRALGHHIFLDLKLHDIPNTVGEGLCSLMRLGADIVNVHASGGFTMMKTAAEKLHALAEKQGVPCPKIIAVTILTSINEENIFYIPSHPLCRSLHRM